jgi:uncharacterized membrane protein YbhN (UPF0104 family)
MWLVTAWPFALGLQAAGANVSFRDGLLILLVVTFAIALPSAPGFVGTFHAGFVLGAQAVGVPPAIAVPAAVVTHLFLQVPFVLAGAATLGLVGTSLLKPPQGDGGEPGGGHLS